MPRDVAYGREIARVLSGEFLGRITDIFFTYDSYLELDQLEPSKSFCVITPFIYSQIRESRTSWREESSLSLSMISAVGPTDDPQWMDDWLDSWDSMNRFMRNINLFGRDKVLAIEQENRYDSDLFHTHKRLFIQATIQFHNLLEV